MTDGRDDGWRSDLRRVLAAWVHILAAAALALGAWATGAATGYAVVLFILLFLLVVFRNCRKRSRRSWCRRPRWSPAHPSIR